MITKRLFPVLRLIFSLAVAAWAINWVVAQAGANLQHEFKTCNWGWIVVTVLLTALGTAVSSYRWSCLLALQQVVISQWDAFRLTMIGVFFNLFGLGGVGGDVFKMYYVRSHAGERTTEAMLSIVVDRVLGLLGLFAVALASLPFVWNELRVAPASIQSMAGFVVLISLVGGGGVTLVLSRDLWLPASTKEGLRKVLPTVEEVPWEALSDSQREAWSKDCEHPPELAKIHWTQLSRFAQRDRLIQYDHSLGFAARYRAKLIQLVAKVAHLVAKLVRSLDLYRTELPQLFIALALSALGHTLATISVYCVAQAFHVQGVAMRFYFLGVQVANTISAVPITPSGLGSRDMVLSAFFKFAGADARCGLIPFGLSCIIVLWSLVGGIFFVMAKRSGEVPPELEQEESES
jgi:uncharacterized membrane protein YbhN (UPF0104 family)